MAILYLPSTPDNLVRRPLPPGQVSAVEFIEIKRTPRRAIGWPVQLQVREGAPAVWVSGDGFPDLAVQFELLLGDSLAAQLVDVQYTAAVTEKVIANVDDAEKSSAQPADVR